MLEILLGTEQGALEAEILGRICAAAAAGETGMVLLVPEQYSHQMERALCRAGGDTICRSAEVLSFTRLAARVGALYGGVSRPALDQGGRLMAMASAMELVGSRLKLYGAVRRKPEFLLRLLAVLDELKAARVDARQLRETARLAQGQLAVKLEELALIQESLDTVAAGLGQDANDRLARLAATLETCGYAEGRRVFLLGFSDWTALELSVLGNLAADAAVTVALLGDGGDRGPFAVAAAAVRQLKALAVARGAAFRVTRLPAASRRPAALAHLTDALFGGGAPWPEAPAELTLHHSATAHSACLELAGQVQQLAEAGWRYRDMAVCCADMETYRPLLEAVFRQFSIPLYISGADPLESDPVTGMIGAALDAATGGMETGDVLRFLKSGLSPAAPGDVDRLETYARTWRIRGRRWEQPWELHPDGAGFPMDDRARERLEALNGLRADAVAPLAALRDGLRDAADTAGQVTALYDFLEAIGLAATLEALEARCRSAAQLRQAQAYGQMYDIVVGALEQLHSVLGRTRRPPEDFAALVSAVLSQYTVGTIPANLDSVTAGSPAAMRFARCRVMLVAGAVDGAFPAYESEKSLLTEQDRRQLQRLGLAVAPGRSFQLDRELTAIYQVLSAPAKRLWVGYEGDAPSYLFTRMTQLFPHLPVAEDGQPPAIVWYSAEALAEAAAGGRLGPVEAWDGGPVADRVRQLEAQAARGPGALSREGVEALYGRKLRLSASRIDQYAACRCAYFLRYGLKLRPEKEAAFDAPFYGTFVHAVLETTARRVGEEGGFRQVDEARLEAIAREAIDGYRDETLEQMLARSQRLAYLFQRSRADILEVVRELGRELRASDFQPAGFEVEFSAAGPMGPVEIAGETVRGELSGFVDRVDLYTCGGTTYVRVVDYKTGKKAFDYTDLLNGLGLQMLIYLFALADGGQAVFGRPLRPAGVLYFPARLPILPAAGRPTPQEAREKRRAELVRQGILLRGEPSLEAMEHFREQPLYMPFSVAADGSLKGDLADGGQLALLRRHVERVLARMADDIAAGAVTPNPLLRGSEDTACAWCDYAQVCHRASGEVEGRPMRKTERKRFWEELEKEADHG